jgi:NitT/TauT family transport system ATP-binding protein
MRLVADRISHSYGPLTVLDDVSFAVGTGEVVAVVGPSGCGKSTLLRILGGLERPGAGQALLTGEPPAGSLNPLTFVFQDFALLPWATTLRNAAFGLELRGLPRAEREEVARRHLREVGLAGFEDRYPHELSGGMRQRVGLARALAVGADVLLMDEPFSAVDEQTRRKFQEDLLRLVDVEKKTFIFVTHSIEEAVYVSDRVVLLSRRPGRVWREIETNLSSLGDPDEIRRSRHYLDVVDEIWQLLKQYVE